MSQYKIKLTYFNATGRGETTRLAFFIGNIKFEDNRVTYDDMPTLKPSLPFGQLPVLEVNGEQICQSIAHMTFAAKLSGLLPDCPVSLAKVYQVLGSIEDIWGKAVAAYYNPDAAAKKKLMSELGSTVFPTWVSRMEKIVEREGKNGYSVGDKMTIADVNLYASMNWILHSGLFADAIDKNALNKAPSIKKVMETVDNHPKVKEWYSMKH